MLPLLQGAELTAAVDAALQSVNLYNGGVGDKQVRRRAGSYGQHHVLCWLCLLHTSTWPCNFKLCISTMLMLYSDF